MSDVIAMRGETLTTQPDEERTRLIALVPAATSLEYSTTLAAATGGRGVMSVRRWMKAAISSPRAARWRAASSIWTDGQNV